MTELKSKSKFYTQESKINDIFLELLTQLRCNQVIKKRIRADLSMNFVVNV